MKKRLLLFFWTLIAALTALFVGYCDKAIAPISLPDEGEPALLYSTQLGDDLRRLYLEILDSAEESIFITSYTFTDRRIAAKLQQKQQRGVDVIVVCDKEASPHARRLLGANVKLILRHDKGLMHTKIALIDGQRVIIGTANLTSESLTAQGNLVAVMNSKALANFLAEGLSSQLSAHGHASMARQTTFSIGGQTVEMWLLPNGKARERLLQLIASAEKTIRVAMFTFTRHDLAQALSRATKRGVAVHVTLDRQQCQSANKSICSFISRLQIPLSVSTRVPLFHYKFMEIDNKILVCGSANWTRAAFSDNDDCFFVLYPLTPTQQTLMRKLGSAIDADSEPLEALYELEGA